MCMDNYVAWRKYKRFKSRRTVQKYKHLIYKHLFIGEYVYSSTHRHEGVIFHYNITEIVGVVHAVFGPKRSVLQTSNSIVIIFVLEEVDADHDNSLVDHEYEYIRHSYVLNKFGSIETITVQDDSLIRPGLVVVDPSWLRKRLGLMQRFHDLREDPESQRHISFFPSLASMSTKQSNNPERISNVL